MARIDPDKIRVIRGSQRSSPTADAGRGLDRIRDVVFSGADRVFETESFPEACGYCSGKRAS